MFRHVVLLDWVEGATEGQKQAVRDRLTDLPGQIPEIAAYRFGDDAGLAPDNFDLAIVADFENEADFVVYRDHPAHLQAITDVIKPILARRVAVQHEWHSALPSDLPA